MSVISLQRQVFLAAIILSVVLIYSPAGADIIYMKDGREIKGILIEEYKDRVVFSTAEGESEIMKSEISSLYLDDEESNLIKLGDQAMDGHKYMKAVGYYRRALKLNPNSRQAKDSLIYLQLYISGQGGSMIGGEVRKQNEIDRDGGSIMTEKDESDALKEAQADLARSLGLTLSEDGNLVRIGAIKADSLAYDAGVRKGDIIIAIWGRFTRYMTIREVSEYLLKKVSPEIRCTIERYVQVAVNKNKNIFTGPEDLVGASLAMEVDGLTVSKVKPDGAAYRSGLKEGDLIVAIGGISTRYMPLKKAVQFIRDAEDRIGMSIRRDVLIWRKDIS